MSSGTIAFEVKTIYNLSLHVQTIEILFSYMIRVNPWDVRSGLAPLFYWFMNIQSLIGRKIDQTQGFLEDGTRVPLSIVSVASNVVSQIKTSDKEGYNAIQLGFGIWKKPNKPMVGHMKKAGIENTPRFFRELRVDTPPDQNLGSAVSVQEVFEPGDVVDVTGTSKGKGFAGVVKRHGFHGGPKTHGQSDRHRAPGSIGSGTTPGRVLKGKKMAGRMGNEQVTVKNLEVLDIQGETIMVRGLIPGVKGSVVVVRKVGKNKKFIPLYSEHSEDPASPAGRSEGQKVSEPENQLSSVPEEQKGEENIEVESGADNSSNEEVKGESDAS